MSTAVEVRGLRVTLDRAEILRGVDLTVAVGEWVTVIGPNGAGKSTLLLLDEPTSALDIGHQQEVLELVDGLRRERGLTVVTTMHDLSVAGEYADRLVLLVEGRVVATGPPEQVLTEPLLTTHYRARVRVIAGEHGPVVVPVRR